MKKDKCFVISDKSGHGTIMILATKRPSGKTLEALQDLFHAAHKFHVGEAERLQK